jgi:hypothetical protein
MLRHTKKILQRVAPNSKNWRGCGKYYTMMAGLVVKWTATHILLDPHAASM